MARAAQTVVQAEIDRRRSQHEVCSGNHSIEWLIGRDANIAPRISADLRQKLRCLEHVEGRRATRYSPGCFDVELPRSTYKLDVSEADAACAGNDDIARTDLRAG